MHEPLDGAQRCLVTASARTFGQSDDGVVGEWSFELPTSTSRRLLERRKEGLSDILSDNAHPGVSLRRPLKSMIFQI